MHALRVTASSGINVVRSHEREWVVYWYSFSNPACQRARDRCQQDLERADSTHTHRRVHFGAKLADTHARLCTREHIQHAIAEQDLEQEPRNGNYSVLYANEYNE